MKAQIHVQVTWNLLTQYSDKVTLFYLLISYRWILVQFFVPSLDKSIMDKSIIFCWIFETLQCISCSAIHSINSQRDLILCLFSQLSDFRQIRKGISTNYIWNVSAHIFNFFGGYFSYGESCRKRLFLCMSISKNPEIGFLEWSNSARKSVQPIFIIFFILDGLDCDFGGIGFWLKGFGLRLKAR